MQDLRQRAQNLRIRLAALRVTHGVTIRQIAREIEYTPQHLSQVLRGVYKSEALCDKLERRMNEIEDEQLQMAA